MTSPVSMQQLIDAGTDCGTIASIATSTAETVIDRLGQTKLTMTGACNKIGFEQPTTYSTSGQTLTRSVQTVTNDGLIYAPALGTIFPFTTSGAFNILLWRVISSVESTTILDLLQANVISDLRSSVPIVDRQLINVVCHTNITAGGGGEFVWDALSTSSDDNAFCIKVTTISTGRWLRKDTTKVTPQMFGALGNFDILTGSGSDDKTAFQSASDFCVANKKKVFVPQPVSGYLFRSGWDLTSNSTLTRSGLNIVFENKSTQYQRGTLIYGETGNNAVIDTCGSDGIYIKNLGITRGFANKSTIGLLQARTDGVGSTGWAGDQHFENPYIDMGSDTSANNGLGTICAINISGEETKYESPQFWGNLPLVISWSKTLISTDKNLGDTANGLVISSAFVPSITSGGSNTVFAITGLGRLIANDFISPCVLINAAGTVDLGTTFMQKRKSNIPGAVVGSHVYPMEAWGLNQFKHYGAVENCRAYLLNRRDLTNVSASVRFGDTELIHDLPMVLNWSDGGVYRVDDLLFNIDSPASTTKKLIGWRKYLTTGGNEPTPFSMSDINIKINKPFDNTSIEQGSLLKCTSAKFSFTDRTLNYSDSGSVSTKVEKNIGNSAATPVEICRVKFPTAIAGLSAIGASINFNGVLTTAVASSIGANTSSVVSSLLSISSDTDGTLIVSTPVNSLLSTSAINPPGNVVSSLNISTTVDNISRTVTILAHGTTSGVNQADLLLKGCISLISTSGQKGDVVLNF